MVSETDSAAGERVVSSGCAHHCGGSCLWKVHLKNGVITRLEADDSDVEEQLRGCLRGHAFRQLVYAPDRLKYPLRRTGERGSGHFERISWNEALDTVASELKRIKEQYGNRAIISLGTGGGVGLVHGMGQPIRRLLNLFGGSTDVWGAASWEAATFASVVNYGTTSVANTRDDLLNSKLIILWGVDPTVTIHSTNTAWYLAKARDAGARLISIDPRYNATTAALAHQWIPIIPGSDTAMALAMAYVMLTENLQDQAFLNRYTAGFAQFKEYVLGASDGMPKSPQWAEQHTGVAAATIRQVARDYATIRPGALISGIGPGRTAFGEQFHRATMTLAAMTGNVGVHGGEAAGRSLGDQYPFNSYPFKPGLRMNPGENPVDKEAPARHIALRNYTLAGQTSAQRSLARLHKNKIADAILRGKAGGYHADYKAFISYTSNPVNQFPSTLKWDVALRKLEFMVVIDAFMTPTARYADIILPNCTLFERNEVVASGATPFYSFQKKVIEPLGESKSQLDICALLASRLGIDPRTFNDKTDEEWVKQIATGGGEVPDWEAFKESAIYRLPLREPYVCFKEQIEDPENHPFPTPSGKIEIYSQLLADMKDPLLPPIPTYFEPSESRRSPLAKKYPLQMITHHFKRRAHSALDSLPWLRELVPNNAEINASDAEARGIKDGDTVRVYNNRGEIRINATVTETIMPGVISVPEGAWFQPDEKGIDRGGCPNTLCSEEHSPCGSYTWNTCLVEVAKARD